MGYQFLAPLVQNSLQFNQLLDIHCPRVFGLILPSCSPAPAQPQPAQSSHRVRHGQHQGPERPTGLCQLNSTDNSFLFTKENGSLHTLPQSPLYTPLIPKLPHIRGTPFPIRTISHSHPSEPGSFSRPASPRLSRTSILSATGRQGSGKQRRLFPQM